MNCWIWRILPPNAGTCYTFLLMLTGILCLVEVPGLDLFVAEWNNWLTAKHTILRLFPGMAIS